MIYPNNFEQKIGFTEIRTLLLAHCLSPLGHERVDKMEFLTVPQQIRTLHRQVQELQTIMAEQSELPEQDFHDLRTEVQRIRIDGTYLEEPGIWNLYRSLNTLHSWVELSRKEEEQQPLYPSLAALSTGVFTFYSVTKRAEQLLDKYGKIRDNASAELASIRTELRRAEGSVSHTLQSILRTAKAAGLVEKDVSPTLRDGRLVIPVSPAMKRKMRGIVHDESASGKTIFIEPAEVVEANNRIRELEANEKREVIRILREFTESLRPNIPELLRGFEFLADIEFIRAKALLGTQIRGISPHIADAPQLDWIMAKHPILELNLQRQHKKIIPLDIDLHRRQRILIISGPNAGGKSVCLKTVGLLQYMLQCGIPVPMAENSRCGVFRSIFIDIGDEQSIEDDLSTYSSHLLNMKNMMKNCDPNSLLLIDEFGGGTEPGIGGAIAESVLRRFVDRGTFGVITTHYQNLKHFADDTPTVVNGAMLYDRHRMEALYQLQIGNPGSSFAVEIARKIGIPEDVISDATELVGKEYVNADKYLLDITRDKRYWEGKRQAIHSQVKQMESTIQRYEKEIAELQIKRREIIQEAKKQAEQILNNSNALIENTIREIREAQAEKDRTRSARLRMEQFRLQLEEEQRHEHDELIEKKMRQIQDRKKRRENRKEQKQQEEALRASITPQPTSRTASQPSEEIKTGDHVRLRGQTTVGTVESIQGKMAIVTFGMMRTTVDLKRLQIACTPPPQPTTRTDYLSRATRENVREKHLHFHQDIDVRGMRGEEAILAVTYFIDDAILVGAGMVRILHGTGNGILRQLIRQYLNTVPGVANARDEHIQLGGAGITVVELK